MSECGPNCQHCGQPFEVSREELSRLVTSNREAAMQALRIDDPRAVRPRFQMQPYAYTRENGEPAFGLRRAGKVE